MQKIPSSIARTMLPNPMAEPIDANIKDQLLDQRCRPAGIFFPRSFLPQAHTHGKYRSFDLHSKLQPGRPQAAEGRMFVTYPQSGNGQRQVMSDHRRNMFLSFHLVVVSRDPRVRVSLSLSQAIGSRNNMLLRSDGCFPSPALPPRRKGHDMRCARPWACKMISCSIAELLAL